jgi:hypothetical protein
MLPIPCSATRIATILEACCIPLLLLLLFEVHARTREPETTEIPRYDNPLARTHGASIPQPLTAAP